MGFFDLFKSKAAPEPTATAEPAPAPEPYLGDLTKTNTIFQLVDVPPAARDDAWQDAFLANLPAASFRCGTPQVITGPDGFPYFQLLLPEPNQSFQCYVLDRMKDDFLLRLGLGVVINPDRGQPDWVLTAGDVLNYALTGEFYTTAETPFSRQATDETIQEDEEVLVGQPNETLLPAATRIVLRDFLTAHGVPDPKLALLMRHAKTGPAVAQDLVFNVVPDLFPDEATYRQVMQRIGWYLPRHYSVVGMEESALGDAFEAL
ncbi:hypothetical protein [Hymenobacter algoricola]|uniref:Uncharacterized protein n=1 Tax=Hymenobacter algoricola TaxID=486267 RepID=A0ABP7N9M9_9BACT